MKDLCHVLCASLVPIHSYMTHPVRILLLFIQDGTPPKKDKVDEAVVEEKKVRYYFFGERYVISMWCICVIGRESL